MPFLTKGKTNWKYVLVVLILALIVSGGIWVYLRCFDKEISYFTKFPEIKKPEKIVAEKSKAKEIQEKLLHEAVFKSFCDECGGCEESMGDWGKLIDVGYKTEEIDLNDDGKKEVIAEGGSCIYEFYSSFMGGVTGNKLFHVFQWRENNWVEIGNLDGLSYSIKETKTNGYHDIVDDARLGSAGCDRLLTYYKWDGSYYRPIIAEEENACRGSIPCASDADCISECIKDEILNFKNPPPNFTPKYKCVNGNCECSLIRSY
jgi:hypothetical protein